jgi:tetratricopeptide (TPR) repeat protein
MFTEDYLMRIISQALAVLMNAIGLRKAGKYAEASQAVEQAIEQLTTLPANVVDQMEDVALLSMLTVNGQLDIGRLAILADLYQEQGEILSRLDRPAQGLIAFGRALRFILEVTLAEDAGLSIENIGKVELLVKRSKSAALPVETQLALSDYYQRLLEKDDRELTAAGTSRPQVSRMLAGLQDQINSTTNTIGD